MKKKIWIAIGVVAVIALLFGINIWKNVQAGNVTMKVTTLKEETITEQVMTPGTLRLANQQTIYFSPEKGKIVEYYVEEGADVKAGDPLFRYENNALDLEKRQNNLQRQSSQLQLNSLQDQLSDLNKQLKEEKENEMVEAERDQVNLQVKQARLEMEQLGLQKQSIEEQIAELTVRSDMDGKVVSIHKDASTGAGAAAAQPQSIMQIGTLDQLIVKGTLSEYDTLKIQQDQDVVLTSDAMPGESWTGKVSFIAYLPEEAMGLEETGVQYPIEVTVNAQNMSLKPGFQMVMEIVTDERKAQTLPLTAVKQEDAENYVFKVVDGKTKKQEVKVGLVSDEHIEIISGLKKEDQVLVEPGDDVTSGMEVNVK
ncbi:efflux RND transporter periplasmic adaptor subunit [Niallia sp. XMNu-256]|uniref:efflux RND transporter periplasmic adaptor subunit n=1 Tax=Niallia sp. XMNu-256 TaxID=3082444 RepID=UPI0030CF4EDE